MSETDDPTTPPPGETPPGEEQQDTTDWKAEAEKWMALSRKNEERAKENAAAAIELETLRRSSMTDQERAVAEAKAAARAEVIAETATRLAAAEVRAALAGVVDNPDVIVDDLNLAKYVTEDGDVDRKAVKALAERYAKLSPATGGTADLKQGARTPPPSQVDGNDWLRHKVSSRQ